MNKLFRELQRQNVIKSSISYVALSWVLLEAALNLANRYPGGIDHKMTLSPKELLAAFIYNLQGLEDRAQMENVLSKPNYYTVEWLKKDLRYKNIRSNPGYEKLIATYAVPCFNDLYQ